MIERRWESDTFASRMIRAALTPPSWLYGAAVAIRNRCYDTGVLASHPLGLPTMSIGNLTVGGTGKTPIASWFAQQIIAAGGRPAILLRGYGGDEVQVHRHLTPQAVVIPGADRVVSSARARAAGATAIVLDDGFQHRRAQREADVVILSADRHRQVRLLPSGPWREPFGALQRATHIVVTRKRSTPAQAREVLRDATRRAPRAEVAIVHLAADALVQWGGCERRRVESVSGSAVLAIAGIGDPQAFEAQLCVAGARVALRAFGDHHAFRGSEVSDLAREAERTDFAVCTLKDAVKLAPLWPASAPPLWYVSQRVSIELGQTALDGLVRHLARSATD